MNCTVCNKPIDYHEVGRETDKCIAEKLGLKNIHYRSDPPKEWETVDRSDWVHEGADVGLGVLVTTPLPRFTSPDSMDIAWGLVEKIGANFQMFSTNGEWRAGRYGYIHVDALTPQLTICRAFLAMDVK